MILTTNEYSNDSVQNELLRFGIAEHPSSSLFNDRANDSVLENLRNKTQEVLSAAKSEKLVNNLYYASRSFFCPHSNDFS
jgi:hypothetical protein